jgi:hypothetical protein
MHEQHSFSSKGLLLHLQLHLRSIVVVVVRVVVRVVVHLTEQHRLPPCCIVRWLFVPICIHMLLPDFLTGLVELLGVHPL